MGLSRGSVRLTEEQWNVIEAESGAVAPRVRQIVGQYLRDRNLIGRESEITRGAYEAGFRHGYQTGEEATLRKAVVARLVGPWAYWRRVTLLSRIRSTFRRWSRRVGGGAFRA